MVITGQCSINVWVHVYIQRNVHEKYSLVWVKTTSKSLLWFSKLVRYNEQNPRGGLNYVPTFVTDRFFYEKTSIFDTDAPRRLVAKGKDFNGNYLFI